MEEILIPSIIGFILSIMIMYYLIHSAVKDAIREQSESLRQLARFKALEMKKSGFTFDEISEAVSDQTEIFWSKLKEK